MLSSLSRRSPETGPGVESGGGGGECRLSLKSVDSTETRAAVVDSLGVRVRVRVRVRIRVRVRVRVRIRIRVRVRVRGRGRVG